MLLVAIDHAQVTGGIQIITAVTAAPWKPVLALVGGLGPGRLRPRCSALLAPRPRRPILAVLLLGGAGFPGSSSFDGGFEEFPSCCDSRCSSLASLPEKDSLASISSASYPARPVICRSSAANCPACAAGCPAWRRTTTISSSRDISSDTDTRRSKRTPADQPRSDTLHSTIRHISRRTARSARLPRATGSTHAGTRTECSCCGIGPA